MPIVRPERRNTFSTVLVRRAHIRRVFGSRQDFIADLEKFDRLVAGRRKNRRARSETVVQDFGPDSLAAKGLLNVCQRLAEFLATVKSLQRVDNRLKAFESRMDRSSSSQEWRQSASEAPAISPAPSPSPSVSRMMSTCSKICSLMKPAATPASYGVTVGQRVHDERRKVGRHVLRLLKQSLLLRIA